MNISPLGRVTEQLIQPSATPKSGEGFGALLEQSINRVEAFRADAKDSVDKFINGEQGDLHSVALSSQRAELEFELMLQIRNKVVQAYQEIMRMQI